MGRFKRGENRLVETFTFAAGVRQPSELSVPARFIKRIWLNITGTLTISAVTVPGAPHADGVANIISKVELNVDGDPRKLGSLASFFRVGQRYDQTLGYNVGLVSGAAGVYPFQCVVPILLESPGSVNPLDSLLDGRLIKNLELVLTWATAADLMVGETSTLALTNAQCEVYFEDTEPFPTDGAFWKFEETETTYQNIITQNERRLQLPYKIGSIVRGVQLRSIDGADLSDAVINSLTIRINGQEQPWRQLEDDYLKAVSQHAFGLDQVPDGYMHLELAEGGRILTTGLGASEQNQINTIDLLLDTTVGVGATSIVAHMLQLVPPDLADVAAAQ